MASKKASASSPVSARIVAARSGEVSGPVAMMTLSHSSGGSATSPRVERDERLRRQRRRHGRGKSVAVDRQRAAGRHLVAVGRAHDQRAEPAHFRVQQADRVVILVVGAERIRADQFGVAVGLVRGGRAQRPHLVQHDRHAGLRQLPGGFRAGEAAADDVDGFQGHGRQTRRRRRARQPALQKRKRPRRARALFRADRCSA